MVTSKADSRMLTSSFQGDRGLPHCDRCLRSGLDCVYPTSRKRPAFDKQYRTFRSRLLKDDNSGQLGSSFGCRIDPEDISDLAHRADKIQIIFWMSSMLINCSKQYHVESLQRRRSHTEIAGLNQAQL